MKRPVVSILFGVCVLSIWMGAGFLRPSFSFLNFSSRESQLEPWKTLQDLIELKSPFSRYESVHLAQLIWEESEKYGIDPYYILAIIEVESNFDPDAVSPKGAIGLMQLMPETAVEIARDMGFTMTQRKITSLLTNPYFNVKMGIAYFAKLSREFQNQKLATLAYFWGPNNVRRFIRASLFPADTYFQKVSARYRTSFQRFLLLARSYTR